MADTPGMSVGLVVGNRYTLAARIGGGGFGSVWRGHDATLDRDVAVKMIALDRPDTDRQALAERFWREARALASLNHPNIVTAYDFGVHDDSAYLVMELISGGSLADELARRRAQNAGPLDVTRVARIGSQISAGLAAAHTAGFVHRDLKPANIMVVRPTGTPKIVDFGIARISDMSRLTVPGDYLGTLPYASPEQMRAGEMDGRSDLYSLGCLLYELLTGRSPYQADSPAAWISAHQFAPPAPLRQHLPDAPPDLEALLRELLAKDPAHRPASANAVRVRLDRIAAGAPAVPTVAAPPPTLIDSRRPVPRQPLPAPVRSPAGAPLVVATPYGWQPLMTPTPYGWQPMAPPGRPVVARPLTATVAGRLLMGVAIGLGLEAVLAAAAVATVSASVSTAFAGLGSTAAGPLVVYLMFVVVGATVGTVIVGLLAGANLRGSGSGRVWTWVLAIPMALVFFGGVGTRGTLTSLATPTGTDALRSRVVAAMATVRAAIPGWYVLPATLINLFSLMAVIVAAVLLLAPASSAYVAARRRR